MKKRTNQQGQAVLEYILMVAMVVGIFIIVMNSLSQAKLSEKLLTPFNKQFAMAYKYGKIDAAGYDEGDPHKHPRIYISGSDNYRLFYAPEVK